MTFEDMARLHHACFAQHRAWPAREIADLLMNPHNFVLTRENGFLIGAAVAGEAEILTLAVSPATRRQGIGRALVAEFLDIARQKGAERAFLEVEAGNAPAIALYAGCGFSQIGLRRAYYQGPDGQRADALILGCPLSQHGQII